MSEDKTITSPRTAVLSGCPSGPGQPFTRLPLAISSSGTTPVNRGEDCDGLKKRGSFRHPARRDLPVLARSRPQEADDEPACPILPQPAVPYQRAAGPGEHAGASPNGTALLLYKRWA